MAVHRRSWLQWVAGVSTVGSDTVDAGKTVTVPPKVPPLCVVGALPPSPRRSMPRRLCGMVAAVIIATLSCVITPVTAPASCGGGVCCSYMTYINGLGNVCAASAPCAAGTAAPFESTPHKALMGYLTRARGCVFWGPSRGLPCQSPFVGRLVDLVRLAGGRPILCRLDGLHAHAVRTWSVLTRISGYLQLLCYRTVL